MGILSRENANGARLVAVGAIVGGLTLAMDFRPSGLAFGIAGAMLYTGAGEELPRISLRNFLLVIGFFVFTFIGFMMIGNGH